jgi:hypothetical protein
MEERRKIVVPLGAEPETPHFDAEETLLSARPVVPITHAESAPIFKNTAAAQTRPPFYRRSLFLSLIVIAAVGIGLAAGLAIARYRYLQRSAAPVAQQPAQAQPAANDTRTTATVQTPKDEPVIHPALPEVKTEEKTTVDAAAGADESARATTTAPEVKTKAQESSTDRKDEDKDDNVKTATPPPAQRDRKRTSDDENDESSAPRAQRRERRVRNRSDDDTVDIPRRMERASEQINRIREIFEGRPQRP